MWAVGRRRGSAAELHHLDLLALGPGAWRLEVSRAALVLGSTQPEESVDPRTAAATGVEVVRRRSGGGAVLLEPDAAVWVDVVIGRDDPRWTDDVDRAALWLGSRWAHALGGDAEVHHGSNLDRELGRIVCFAGLARGEVTVGGRKVVGISQRRDRRGARFQCVLHLRWDPAKLVDLLAPALEGDLARDALVDRLGERAAAVADAPAVADRLVAGLAAEGV